MLLSASLHTTEFSRASAGNDLTGGCGERTVPASEKRRVNSSNRVKRFNKALRMNGFGRAVGIETINLM
jgi:hypothetical protein